MTKEKRMDLRALLEEPITGWEWRGGLTGGSKDRVCAEPVTEGPAKLGWD
jgi:hypothetical protein